jgi:hypothetical protein
LGAGDQYPIPNTQYPIPNIQYQEVTQMSAYKLADVIQMWAVGKLTTEQAIGQILQLIQERDKRLQELEDRVAALRQAMNG